MTRPSPEELAEMRERCSYLSPLSAYRRDLSRLLDLVEEQSKEIERLKRTVKYREEDVARLETANQQGREALVALEERCGRS